MDKKWLKHLMRQCAILLAKQKSVKVKTSDHTYQCYKFKTKK